MSADQQESQKRSRTEEALENTNIQNNTEITEASTSMSIRPD